jgi:hypothetical protein
MSSNASRVPGEVNSIDHFGLNIPSIQDAKSFFTAFELGNPQRIDECIRLYPDNAEWDALCDQRSRSSRVTRCKSVMKSAPSITFARVATGVTLALAVIAGISAAPQPGLIIFHRGKLEAVLDSNAATRGSCRCRLSDCLHTLFGHRVTGVSHG